MSNFVVLRSRELLLFNVTEESVGNSTYECQLKFTLTDQVFASNKGVSVYIYDPGKPFAPAMLLSHPRKTVKEGEAAELPCVAEGYPPPSFRWYREISGELVAVQNQGERVQVNRGILSFEPVHIDDSASYICVAHNNVGEVRGTTRLIVLGPLTVEIYPQWQTLNVEEVATLICNMSQESVENLVWIKDGEPLALGERYNFTGNIFHILGVGPGDKGMYQCFARDEGRTAQGSSELAIRESAPRIKSSFPELLSTLWANISLKCVAVGNPQPLVTWYANDIPVTSNTERLTISTYEPSVEGKTTSYLNITEILSVDGGKYSCKAENKLGSVSHSAMLTVNTKLRVHHVRYVTAMVGQRVFLDCPYTTHSIQSVRWIKDGLNLPVADKMCMGSDGLLCVGDLEMDTDEGKYECDVTGTTEDGVTTGFVYLTVTSDTLRMRCAKLKESNTVLRADNQAVSKCPESQICLCNTATQQLRVTVLKAIVLALFTLVYVTS